MSSHGKHCIVIFYYCGTDRIQVIPTKIRNAAEIWDATMPMLSILTTSMYQSNIHILDNKALSSLKQGLIENNIKYQFVTLYLQKSNAAKCAIK